MSNKTDNLSLSYYEVKTVMARILENGMLAEVKETYIVKAYTCTEVEARIIEELAPFDVNGTLRITGIAKTKISEVLRDYEDGPYYRVKAILTTVDETSEAEKKRPYFYLVKAPDFATAHTEFEQFIVKSIGDWSIHTIQETAIVGVYERDEDKQA